MVAIVPATYWSKQIKVYFAETRLILLQVDEVFDSANEKMKIFIFTAAFLNQQIIFCIADIMVFVAWNSFDMAVCIIMNIIAAVRPWSNYFHL